jgi:ABC-type uncharacterized transport system auxiliary subunit
MIMHSAKRPLASLSLAATLALSAALASCSSTPQTVTVTEPEHHWDEHENQAWHRYLAENHRQERDYARAEKQEQSDYWNWRHNHPD